MLVSCMDPHAFDTATFLLPRPLSGLHVARLGTILSRMYYPLHQHQHLLGRTDSGSLGYVVLVTPSHIFNTPVPVGSDPLY